MAPAEQNATNFSAYADQVQNMVRTTVDAVLGVAPYDANEVPQWVDTMTAGMLDNLQKMSDGFKYVVSIVVLQRSNAGFHLFSTCYWDQSLDGTVTVQWENKTMHCIVTVFGVAL